MQRSTLLLILAALSFIPTLWLYMVGEEGIYTISSMEMWHNNNWLIQTLYGIDQHRPPLMNWLVMPLAELIGWSHVLIATRTVSILATLGLTAWLYLLCCRLFDDKVFSRFAALACLSLADLLLYRGWLAYTDPIFAFFTFGAIASLWIASIERRHGWLFVSVVLVSCALLTKAFTAYVFYGTTALVLLRQRPQRSFLLSPTSLMIFSLVSIAPFVWFMTIPQVTGHASSMLNEIVRKFTAENWLSYFGRLLTYPVETAIRLSPTTLLAGYLLFRKRIHQAEKSPVHFQTAVLITVLCILPYWLSPQGGIRYLLPIYPMVALVGARIIWRADDPARTIALRWFAAIIAFKFLFALLLFPYYQSHYRGENYVATGNELIQKTAGFTLYADDYAAEGLNIVGFIDAQRYPFPPINTPPSQMESGFILARENNPATGNLVHRYKLAADEIFLLCRGAACTAANNSQ